MFSIFVDSQWETAATRVVSHLRKRHLQRNVNGTSAERGHGRGTPVIIYGREGWLRLWTGNGKLICLKSHVSAEDTPQAKITIAINKLQQFMDNKKMTWLLEVYRFDE